MHGFQLWVNLPQRDKMMKPRYQEIPSSQNPKATSADGLVRVSVIAGEAMGKKAVIETRTPIIYLHYGSSREARLPTGAGLGRIFPNSSTPLTAHYTEIGKVFETIERKREMKIVTLIARILLGLISVVFGLNGFLNFLSMGPMPTGLAGQFHRRAGPFSLLLGCGSAPNCRWRAIASEPIRTARVGAAWAGNREHHLLSRVPESERGSTGGGGNSPVVDCFLWESPTLLRNICATYLRFSDP
jgi:hypothetical protein